MIRSERIAARSSGPFPGPWSPRVRPLAGPRINSAEWNPGSRATTCREAAHYFEPCERFGASRLRCAGSRIAFHGVYPWAGQRPDPRAALRCRRPGKGGGNAAPSWSDSALAPREVFAGRGRHQARHADLRQADEPVQNDEVEVQAREAELDRRDRAARPSGVAEAGVHVLDDDVRELDAREDLAHRRKGLGLGRAARVAASVDDGLKGAEVEGPVRAAARRAAADALVVGHRIPVDH